MTRPVSVLHLTSGPVSGGAAKGALRLHQGLLKLGVDSTLAGESRNDTAIDKFINTAYPWGLVKRKLNQQWNAIKLPSRRLSDSLFSIGQEIFNVYSGIDLARYDIVHCHWINYAVNPRWVSQLAAIKPVVWTLRDMWSFTGGCHYSLDCFSYRTGCGHCPQLQGEAVDLSQQVFSARQRWYKNINFVAISHWLETEAVTSGLIPPNQISTIYNSISPEIFRPLTDIARLRDKWGLNTDKPVVIMGAQNSQHTYKGGERCRQFIAEYRDQYFFLLFGRAAQSLVQGLEQVEYLDVGFVDESDLAELFNLANLFVMPSLQEAFGKTIIESMACGTPVLTGSGSAPEEIQRAVQGYAFILGQDTPEYAMQNPPQVEAVHAKFAETVIGQQYADLYARVLSQPGQIAQECTA